MKRGRTSSYKKPGPYKRTRYAKGSQANPIVIPDTQVRRALNYRTGGLMGIEKKYADRNLAASGLTAPTTIGAPEMHDPAVYNCLNGVTPGDGAENRDGRQITMDNITIKGTVTLPSQTWASEVAPNVFIALVLDKQTNGAQCTADEVFVNPSGVATLNTSLLRNLENVSRFQVLKTVTISADEWGMIAGMGTTTTGKALPFNMFADLKGKKVNFAIGGGGTVSDIKDNSLHLIALTDNIATTPSLAYNSRMRFRG